MVIQTTPIDTGGSKLAVAFIIVPFDQGAAQQLATAQSYKQ
jgi:hypothetical protein